MPVYTLRIPVVLNTRSVSFGGKKSNNKRKGSKKKTGTVIVTENSNS